ncbi:MAG: hypothetical protein S4CHLAM45_06800 [Chlamydiales bacterium]|nr:hypothetical protein [Chlamydiales bacterium]MCH9620302.1 hypothetical protein [Chlamydiales bacterium]MCH9622787.1 hypothetical protein [Chlamydiales bacterium]
MRKVWVVIANRSEVKILRAENVETLVEFHTLKHHEGKLPTQDLTSDKQGSHRGRFGTDTMEEKTSAKAKEAHLFARRIATFLEGGVNKNEVERFYLISTPEFIGVLRQVLKPSIAKLIEKEVHKDVMLAKPDQIRSYLPPVL